MSLVRERLARMRRSMGWFLLALCTLVLGSHQVAAQGIQFDNSPSVVEVHSSVQMTIPPVPGVPIPEASSPAISTGFWIVSTHESPQSFDGTSPQFCPGVIRYDECVGYRRSSFAEMCQSLVPGIPVSIAVHGSFVDWDSVFIESRCTWKWLQSGRPDQPLQMIYFTWPSYRPLGPIVQIDIGILGRRASRNGFYLADLVSQIPVESPISMVGHSHGTRVIAAGLHLMGGGQVEGFRHRCASCAGKRIRVVFAASAIDHDWLNPNERFGRALCCTECLLNLKNSDDLALKIYPLRRPICSSRALGNAGFTSKDHRELGHFGMKVRDLDVSRQIGHHHLWPYYYERPWMSRTISNYVFFPDVTGQNYYQTVTVLK